MPAALTILFGAALTVATAWSLGAILFQKLSLSFSRLERYCLAFIVGSACLSAIDFALAATHLVHKGILLAIGLASVGYALFSGAHRTQTAALPGLPRTWKWPLGAVFSIFTVLYFFNAMAPEMSPDGMAYHLGEVAKYYRAHGFVRIPTNLYSNLSQGIELLFLHAFTYGRHSAAALVHFVYLICLALLILCYGRRIGHPAVGCAASIFVYCSPIVGQDGTVAYNDVALAAILFALFYLLQLWDQDRRAQLLAPIGILAGFSFATKYTAFLAVPYALGFIGWKLWRSRQPGLRPMLLRPMLIPALLATLFIAPWMVKNWMWMDNPVAPFANRLFPNPYVHISFEESYRRVERKYGLASYSQIPLQVTVRGDILSGFFGPLFLLTPLALLALRFRAGRQLWLAALLFGLPFAANVGTRFLIPAVPFVSLALALAFANLEWLLLVLALAHAVASWPSVANLYCGGAAWRLNSIPFAAALRIESEDKFLSAHSPSYNEARMIEQRVPPGERVFAFSPTADAYTSRDIVVSYQAALNETLLDTLLIALIPDFGPSRLITFHVAPTAVRKIRVVQTAQAKDMQWSVFELRAFHSGNELQRAPEWRLTAHPNPWDVQMAFDNSHVTRWRSWQTAALGMFVEIDFGRTETTDQVTIECADEGSQTRLRLEGMDPQGRWSTLSDHPEESTRAPEVNLRGAAAAELKRRGFHYVLVGQDDTRADDFPMYGGLWGMKLVAASGTTRLFHIE
jgi:hypothetical protein